MRRFQKICPRLIQPKATHSEDTQRFSRQYASREELTEAIQAKYPPKEKKDDDDTIPDGSICVEEEMAMQNSPKLNTKPHKPEVRQ